MNDDRYTVLWTMPFNASNPADAVLQAIGVHRDESSIATVFGVEDNETGDNWVIDAELIQKFAEWTHLDSEDVSFFPAFVEWTGTVSRGPAVLSPPSDLAEWWADNQGRFV